MVKPFGLKIHNIGIQTLSIVFVFKFMCLTVTLTVLLFAIIL